MNCSQCPWDYEKYFCLGCYANCSDNEEIQTENCCCWVCGIETKKTQKYAMPIIDENTTCCFGCCAVKCGMKSVIDSKENKVYVTEKHFTCCAPCTLIESRETASKKTFYVKAPCCGMSKETKVTPQQAEALPIG